MSWSKIKINYYKYFKEAIRNKGSDDYIQSNSISEKDKSLTNAEYYIKKVNEYILGKLL